MNKYNLDKAENTKFILKRVMFVILILLFTGILFAFAAKKSKMIKVTVVGDSMNPTLSSGNRIDVTVFSPEDRKGELNIKNGDIVVFKDPENKNMVLVKRIAGKPGDTVEYIDGSLFVNGKFISSPDQDMTERKAKELYKEKDKKFNNGLNLKKVDKDNEIKLDKLTTIQPVHLGKGQYWLVSDNLSIHTVDSRTFGPVSEEDIIGFKDSINIFSKR